jgi:hypothetical protein
MNRTSITPVSEGQKDTASRLAGDVARQAMLVALEQMIEDGEISREELQQFLGRGHTLKARMIPFFKTSIKEIAMGITAYTRCISGGTVILDPSDGQATLTEAKDLFVDGIDDDFEAWGTNVPGEATGQTNVIVHEMIKDGTFAQVYGAFGVELGKLCLTQSQIIQFVQNHGEWARKVDQAIYFLFRVGEKFFVVDVRLGVDRSVADMRLRGGGRFIADAYTLGDAYKRSALNQHRFVLPQLDAQTPNAM